MAERCHDYISRHPLRFSEFCIGVLGLNPYDWQIEALEDVNDFRRTAVVAANGSGKTAALVAPAILWWLTAFPRGRVVVTSGSWRQIQDQMWPAVTKYAVHPMFSRWRWNHLDIKTPEGGFTSIFSTSDPRKAEGYHAEQNAPVLYIVDECKGVKDEIFIAADRCTVTRYLYLSSPGAPQGKHYRCFHSEAEYWRRHKITSFMCPHIPASKREQDLKTYGSEDDPSYRSMHLAEWTEGEDLLIIKPGELREIIENSPARRPGRKVMFFDFAAGGDENAIGMKNGNILSVPCAWRDKSTVQARRRFRREAESRGVAPYDIYGDADGIGLPIVQDFHEEGFRIKPFHGGEKPENDRYSNLISEVWLGGVRQLRRLKTCIEDMDPVTFQQITTRKMEWDAKGRLRLQSKEDMRSFGLPSPDRGDVFFGALWAGSPHDGTWTSESDIYQPEKDSSQIWTPDLYEW